MSLQRSLYIIVILFSSVFIALSGCKKDEEMQRYDYTFTNHTDKNLNLFFYLSEKDYANQQHANVGITVKPNTSFTVPYSQLDEGRLYFLDWYSDDFAYHNWYNTTDDDFREFVPSQQEKVFIFEKTFGGIAREVFLDGDKIQTKWQAIDAFIFAGTYQSVWDTMANDDKFKTITINKSFSAHYTYLSNGAMQTDTLGFLVHRSNIGYIEFRDTNGISVGEISTNRSPYASAPNFYTPSLDTVLARFPDSDYYFALVKQ